ncbi:MAG: 16S rRNA processing protein RimM [Tissierellia bacterium]|nr:16S rRNA processing protein RimM [Tissierellia bacterium]
MILVGRTTKTVGLKGEIRVYLHQADLIELGESYYLDGQAHTIEKLRFNKNTATIKFSQIDSIEEAEDYLNLDLYRRKEDISLDQDEYFYSELLGLRVLSEEGDYLGEIVDIIQPSVQNVYVIKGEVEFLLPAVEEFIVSIDLEKREMTVSLIEGLI